jgi:hypothetical protein
MIKIPYRPGCSEHYVIHVLRDDPAFVKELDFVMVQYCLKAISTFTGRVVLTMPLSGNM